MSLGVGGATTYGMASNYQTAHNHNFRDTSSFNPQSQKKMKCPHCGCWASRGKECYQCKRPVGRMILPRNNNHQVEPASSQFFQDTMTARQLGATMNSINPSSLIRSGQDSRRSSGSGGPSGGGDGTAEPKQNPTRYRDTDGLAATSTRLANTARSSSAGGSRRPMDRLKCKYCGCWAHRGKACPLCRTMN